MLPISGITSYAPLHAGKRIPDGGGFSVPKSPLRIESSRTLGRDARESLAADSVEFSQFNPIFLNAIYPAPHPRQTPAAALGAGTEKDRNRESSLSGQLMDEETRDDGSPVMGDAETDDAEGGRGAKMGEATDAGGEPLDEAGQQQVQKLKLRDQEVRTHEQAHKSVGGSYAGAVSYDYQQGPDGKRYAVGGEVSIDISPENDPAATAAKMRQVRSAALAPAQPSGQDMSVAAEASKLEADARQELSRERMAGLRGNGGAAAGEDASATASGEAARSGGAENAGGTSPAADSGNFVGPLSPGAASPGAPDRSISPIVRLSAASRFSFNTPPPFAAAFGYQPLDVMA